MKTAHKNLIIFDGVTLCMLYKYVVLFLKKEKEEDFQGLRVFYTGLWYMLLRYILYIKLMIACFTLFFNLGFSEFVLKGINKTPSPNY